MNLCKSRQLQTQKEIYVEFNICMDTYVCMYVCMYLCYHMITRMCVYMVSVFVKESF